MMTKFLCISGHARHGKDTSAEMFKRHLEQIGYKVIIVHYADLLKYICKSFFGWNGEKDEFGRTMLQRVGTDQVRRLNPDYWVDFITGVVGMFPSTWDFVIVPDARFPNELYRIVDAGFPMTHIRVVREGFESDLTDAQKSHSSETALDSYEYDYLLHNNTFDQLNSDVCRICEEIQSSHDKFGQLSIYDVVLGEEDSQGDNEYESN
jgi:hypothetical protein